jgi:metallo-beta-lactamase class B
VVIAVSLTAPGYQLWDNPDYPTIMSDFEGSIAKLRVLPCDIFLSLHSWDFGLHEKIAARAKDPTVNPFVDPDGYHQFLDRSWVNLHKQLEVEKRRKPNSTLEPK